MTLKRRTDIMAQAGRPLSARERRHALRLSGRTKITRWIGASKSKRVAQVSEAEPTPAGPPAEVIVLSWKQLFGRGVGAGATPSPMPPMRMGSKLLAFRAN